MIEIRSAQTRVKLIDLFVKRSALRSVALRELVQLSLELAIVAVGHIELTRGEAIFAAETFVSVAQLSVLQLDVFFLVQKRRCLNFCLRATLAVDLHELL